MTSVDVMVVIWVALSAAMGLRRGLVGQALALAGFAVGAFIGSRVGPHLLSPGARTGWQPIAALIGAMTGGIVMQLATAPLADMLRRRMARGPLATADGAGGLVAGAALGLGVAWLLAVTALHQPSLGLRTQVQQSTILPRLVRWLPAQSLLDAIARFDRLPVLPVGGVRALPVPDRSVPVSPAVRQALESVVLVEGTSCGLTLQGSGWVVRPGLVATNAHVVAGEHDTHVVLGDESWSATPVFVSPSIDVALLSVPELKARPIPMYRPRGKMPVALVGYPGGGPLRTVAGTIGEPATVITPNAYGRDVAPRTVVPIRGSVLHGDSGGPAIDRKGRAVAMMFAAADGGGGGYAVPIDEVAKALERRRPEVSTGPCVG
jgi:S1-C subfamily serine protease